jgi:TRAP-type C4-dicarboxylate transport system substrate-binding protein
MSMNVRRNPTGRRSAGTATATVVCLIAGGLAACSAPAAKTDRAGGDTVVLHLATSDGEGVDRDLTQGPIEFVEALDDVSDGRLKVDLTWGYASGAADAETQLVEAIASGEVDGGWPATRAFARAGIEGLGAVEAPMLLTSEAAVEELVSGDIADDVLAQLDGTGMTAVGLMAAPLRRPVSGGKPLVGSEDWDGATFRVYNSPVQAAVVRALGGRPINMTHAWADALRIGDLDGAEADVVTTELPSEVRNITGNVVLWPKVFVTTFSEQLFDSLSGQQQDWIRAAAARATEASVDAPYDAAVDLQAYCDRGTQVHEATGAQLEGLHAAVAPVLRDLRNDPETSDLMRAVDRLAAEYPDTDSPPPAGGCEEAAQESGGLPTTDAPLPAGTYRAEIPEAATAEVGNGDGWSGVWTLRLRDGTFALTCRPLDLPGTDCGHTITNEVLEAGQLKGDNTTVWFIGDAQLLSELSGCELPTTEDDTDACFVVPPYSASWSQEGDQLVFTDSEVQHLTLATWLRVGE